MLHHTIFGTPLAALLCPLPSLARNDGKLYVGRMHATCCQDIVLPASTGTGRAGGTDLTLDPACSGYCAHCGQEHGLGQGEARRHALELMAVLATQGRIDFEATDHEADPRYSTAPLFGEERGQMFGVLIGRDRRGAKHVLRAFSGQYNGLWQAPGWAPPLFDLSAYEHLHDPVEREIKALGRELCGFAAGSQQKESLVRRRRELSRQLMRDIHKLYEITNFRGQTAGLHDVFLGSGMPTGTGDCCAPKLLNQAARIGLMPLGIAEFYWGRENRSASRQHGSFYSSCFTKCRPILGFMLCGLKDQP